jgi:hypothetical protein
MPRTNVWDVNRPPGTELAKNIDNEIRAFRVDFIEILEQSLLISVAADPAVPKPEILGNVNGKKLLVGWPEFQGDNSIYQDEDTHFGVGHSNPMYAQVRLPPGVTVTLVEYALTRGGAASVDLEFYKVAFGSGVKTSITTQNFAGVGYTVVPSIALAEVITSDNFYYVKFDAVGAGFSLFGARISYNTPDCRSTV